MFILISGAASSGKSSYAEKKLISLAEITCSTKIYIATAEIHDAEFNSRIEFHRARRADKGFTTLECARDLLRIAPEIPEDSCVLLEGLTTWTANEMFHSGHVESAATVRESVYHDFMSIKSKCGHIILVSDDIFSDGVTYDDMTESFRRTLAEILVKFVNVADEVIEIFAGLPVIYKSP